MRTRLTLVTLSMLTLPVVSSAESFTSNYVGEEQRVIKSLSAEDIAQLQKGAGWGLAKAAELNGVPGPLHVLEMASKIDLTASQKAQIEDIYKKMQAQAVVVGQQLIEAETALNAAFKDKTVDAESLKTLINNAEAARANLRYVHLSAHLETPRILTKHQIMMYNQLRGYGRKDPCAHVPEGHNPDMWKKHNGCE